MPYERPNFGGIARPDFPVPDDEAPSGTRCVKIHVPDDPQHIQIMLGSLLLLANFLNYQRGQQEKAEAVATLWENIIEATDFGGDETCDMYRVRVDPENPCILQETLDGLEWVDIVDASYLPLDGSCAMIGGLEIEPIPIEPALAIKHAGDWQLGDSTHIIRIARPDGAVMARMTSGGGWQIDTSNGAAGIADLYRLNFGEWLGRFGRGTAVRPTGSLAVMVLQSQTALRPITFWNAGTTTVNLLVQGRPSQSANLQEWASNWNLARVDSFIRANGSMEIGMRDAEASFIPPLLTINRDSSVATSEGFGADVEVKLKSSTTSGRWAHTRRVTWDDATDATRRSRVRDYVYDAGIETKIIDMGVGFGGAPVIGFLGADRTPRLGVTGFTGNIPALRSLISAMEAKGLITDNTTSDYNPPPLPDTDYDWCFGYNFTEQETWFLDTSYSSFGIGQYKANEGWVSDQDMLAQGTVVIRKNMITGAYMRRIRVTVEFSPINFEPGTNNYVAIQYGVTNTLLEEWDGFSQYGIYQLEWEDSATLIGQIRVICHSRNTNNSVRVMIVTLEGDDPVPVDGEEENCYG